MRPLNETIRGDYSAYMAAAMNPENAHFVFMTLPAKAGTVRSFLEANADKGVIFVESESVVDVEFWIAAPKKMADALNRALHRWATDGEDAPHVDAEQPRRGIFHSIMSMPFSMSDH